jgi:hypothetical protein
MYFVLLMEEQRTRPNLSESKNYQQEVEVEPRGNAGERSYSKAETKRGDELNEFNQTYSKLSNFTDPPVPNGT